MIIDDNKLICIYTDDGPFRVFPHRENYRNYFPVIISKEGFSVTAEFHYNEDNLINCSYNIITDTTCLPKIEFQKINSNSNKLNTELNDIVLGDFIVLNFTKKPVTLNTFIGDQYTFAPITTGKVLKELYDTDDNDKYINKVFIYKLRKINNIMHIGSMSKGYYSEEDYLNDFINSNKGIQNKEILEIRDFIVHNWDKIKNDEISINSRSLTVVTMSTITEKELANAESGNGYVTIPDKGIRLSFGPKDLYGSIATLTKKIFDINGDARNLAKDLVFIDPYNEISNRYYNIAGNAEIIHRMPELYINGNKPGLYYRKIKESGELVLEFICSLEEVDSIPFIFKLKEEAEHEKESIERFKESLKQKEDDLKMKFKLNENELKSRYSKTEIEENIYNLKLIITGLGVAGALFGLFVKFK